MNNNKAEKIDENIKQVITEQICMIFGIAKAEVVGNAALVEDLGGDSLDIYETIFAVEEQLDIETDDQTDVGAIRNVRDLMALFGV